MATKKLQLSVPASLIDVLGDNKKAIEKQALEHLVMNLIHARRITLSLGAEALKVTYREMMQLMKDNDIPLINYAQDELDEELETLQKLHA